MSLEVVEGLATEPWKDFQLTWEASHPGYCGLCGLSKKRCIHTNPAYNSEMSTLTIEGKVAEAFQLKFKEYLSTLRKLPRKEILDLPEPPRRWQISVLEKFKRMTDSLPDEALPPPHFYGILLLDDLDAP